MFYAFAYRPRIGRRGMSRVCRGATAQISQFCLLRVITAKAAAAAPNGGYLRAAF